MKLTLTNQHAVPFGLGMLMLFQAIASMATIRHCGMDAIESDDSYICSRTMQTCSHSCGKRVDRSKWLCRNPNCKADVSPAQPTCTKDHYKSNCEDCRASSSTSSLERR
ncbi:hypothetical protein MJO29_012129 [Puccinia striiformis f. sp. tritici]|uniref:hypothetical protein n=1 Tax=Puccinia striiformis f. sp. tritici TaxID=168172 RepID=UPI0020078EC3|nr:hypothetical protein Pst134EA_022820 [Puccinia striiformis f. sp. tritici]KAH9455351.1 hypothetical protein Pst134EA_022820 [Puccinia striiformis f. sp. tritici]KAI7945741.1 hypothetical protein MJO29_012129 [Puccinia striiformis f. sp. tritici]